MRYPKVAREYDSLGHEPFVHKYLTPLIRERLLVPSTKSVTPRAIPTSTLLGFSPRANGYVAVATIGRKPRSAATPYFGLNCTGRRRLFLARPESLVQDQPEIPYDRVAFNPECADRRRSFARSRARPGREGLPTSELCYRACKRLFDPTAEQLAEVA